MPPKTRVNDVIVRGTADVHRLETDILVIDGQEITAQDWRDVLARLAALERA